jgi:uncharacterized protein YbjT (DUF2867 family)
MHAKPVLVTGATGYVGGRLVQRLLDAGYRVRAAGRSLEKIRARPWSAHPHLEPVYADMQDLQSVSRAARGCFAAYYLVHSMMYTGRDFDSLDRQAARNMVQAAGAAGLERIIYLGGLGGESRNLSKHLFSRAEVAKILSKGPVPVTVLRAAMILGSGSASFEILRYLAERLPVMITPRGVHTRCQPISIRNVLNYLLGCLERDETIGRTYDIGGPDIVTYAELIHIYAEQAGLRRRIIIAVPFFPLGLAAYLVGVITPVPPSLAIPLVEGMFTEVICRDSQILSVIPQDLMTCRVSISRALEKVEQHIVDTSYSDAGLTLPPEWALRGDASYSGGHILESTYRLLLRAEVDRAWAPIQRIGGETGWYYWDSLLRIRGFMDKLLGGVGVNRGRRHPAEIAVGDALDSWRVLAAEPSQRLLLLSEMKHPGRVFLELRVAPQGPDETELSVTFRLLPKGLGGVVYWYAITPVHHFMFRGMLQNIAGAIGLNPAGRPFSRS